jgi:hypothetical protein
MPTQLQTLYTGRSGHLAVVAQFLHRGYNAAIPEVDRGEDIFVIEDESGKLSRIQVKAANGHGVGRHYALYAVPPALALLRVGAAGNSGSRRTTSSTGS